MKKNMLFLSCFCILFWSCKKTDEMLFSDISLEAGIDFLPTRDVKGISWGGVGIIDYNNDGYEDIYIPGGSTNDRLYHNNGNSTFKNIIGETGIDKITQPHVTLGVIAGDIDNDGFKDLFITTAFPKDTSKSYFSPNLMMKNNGDGTFTDITQTSGLGLDSVFSGAASFGDINNDGLLDLYVSNLVSDRDIFRGQLWDASEPIWEMEPDRLYINIGDGKFVERSKEYGIVSPGAALACSFLDFNNDGNIDLLIANDDFGTPDSVFPNQLYVNQYPEPKFMDVSKETGVDEKNTSMGIAIGDYDNNGYLDFYVTYCGDNSLFKNSDNGLFKEESVISGTENGDVPINPKWNEITNVVYTYIPDPGFVGMDSSIFKYCKNRSDECMLHKFYIRTIDVEQQDEWHPWASIRINGDSVFLEVEKNRKVEVCFPINDGFEFKFGVEPFNHGQEEYRIVDDSVASTGWGANFQDFNNDRFLDLYVANGSETPSGAKYDNTNTLYYNSNNGRFTDTSKFSGTDCPWPSRGSVTFDFDNDGDQDIFILNLPYENDYETIHKPRCILYRNNLKLNGYNNWLKLKLIGLKSNRDAVGARAILYTGFESQIKNVVAGSSHMSMNSTNLHFGLGPYKTIDSLEIMWPGGCTQKVYNLSVNEYKEITEYCP